MSRLQNRQPPDSYVVAVKAGQIGAPEVAALDKDGETIATVYTSRTDSPIAYWVIDPEGKRQFEVSDLERDGQLDVKESVDGVRWLWFEGDWARVVKGSDPIAVEIDGSHIPVRSMDGKWVRRK